MSYAGIDPGSLTPAEAWGRTRATRAAQRAFRVVYAPKLAQYVVVWDAWCIIPSIVRASDGIAYADADAKIRAAELCVALNEVYAR